MAKTELRGSCLCGAVEAVLSEPLAWAHHCHCARCRKAHGTAFATHAIVPLEALCFTRGEGRLRSYKPPDAERFTNVFCGDCGSPMPFANVARDGHMFVDSRAPWGRIHDDLPQYRGLLGGERVDGGGTPKRHDESGLTKRKSPLRRGARRRGEGGS